eukprot:SAG11_NODE_1270_length_5341_cov_3.290347_4_plen_138_part_00
MDKYFDHGGAASLAFNDSENRRQIAKTNCMSVIEAVLEEHGGAALAFREHAVWLLRTISADPSSPHQNALTLATELPAEFKTKMESSLLDKTVEGCLTATPCVSPVSHVSTLLSWGYKRAVMQAHGEIREFHVWSSL